MRALLLLPQAPLEGRDRPVGDLPGLGSRPDNFWRDRVRAADRPGAKKHHLKKSPLPTLPTPPNIPTIPALPTPTDLTHADLALPALASDAGASACRIGEGRAALQVPSGRRLAQPPLSGEAAGAPDWVELGGKKSSAEVKRGGSGQL